MDNRNFKVSWRNHAKEVSSMLYKLRKEKWHTDATIACDGNYYPVHRIILSSSSQYFEELFQQTEKLHPLMHPVIVLHDIKTNEFEALLDFIYLGEANVVEKNVTKLLDVAKVLNIKGLRDRTLRSVFSTQSISIAPDARSDVQSVDSKQNGDEVQHSEKKRKLQDDNCALENDGNSSSSSSSSAPPPVKRQMRHEAKENQQFAEKECKDKVAAQDVPCNEDVTTSVVQPCTPPEKENDNVLSCEIQSSFTLDDNGIRDFHDQSTSSYLSTNQTEEEEAAVQEEQDETITHTPDESVFISVGISDSSDPLPGPSGLSSTSDVTDSNPKETDDSDADNNEDTLRIKEELVEYDIFVNETTFTKTENTNAVGDVNYVVKGLVEKECHDSENQGNVDSDNGSNSSSSQDNGTSSDSPHKKLHIPVENLPKFLKSYKIYKFSPQLNKTLKYKFWEQEGVHRMMEGIKNQEITMKEAAKLLGPTYSALYSKYSSVYGGIKQSVGPEVSSDEATRQKILNPKIFGKVKFHECPYCNYKNPYRHNFLEHLKFHMGGALLLTPSENANSPKGESSNSKNLPSNPDKFVTCEICSAKFAHLRTLRRHMEIHFHISPLECPFCSVKFYHKTQFTEHIETHKNEKIFDCPVCMEKFADRHTLNGHLKIHYE